MDLGKGDDTTAYGRGDKGLGAGMKIINFEPREETPKGMPILRECGEIETIFNFKTMLYRVHCMACYAKTAPSRLKDIAIRNWNKRA